MTNVKNTIDLLVDVFTQPIDDVYCFNRNVDNFIIPALGLIAIIGLLLI